MNLLDRLTELSNNVGQIPPQAEDSSLDEIVRKVAQDGNNGFDGRAINRKEKECCTFVQQIREDRKEMNTRLTELRLEMDKQLKREAKFNFTSAICKGDITKICKKHDDDVKDPEELYDEYLKAVADHRIAAMTDDRTAVLKTIIKNFGNKALIAANDKLQQQEARLFDELAKPA